MDKYKSNGDRIREMSDEELELMFGERSLCAYIRDKHHIHCKKRQVCDGCILDWLKEPAKEG